MENGLNDRMIRNDEELIVFMPLYKNVPEPKNENWRPTACPKCGRRCWIDMKGLEELKKLNVRLHPLCTECALRA